MRFPELSRTGSGSNGHVINVLLAATLMRPLLRFSNVVWTAPYLGISELRCEGIATLETPTRTSNRTSRVLLPPEAGCGSLMSCWAGQVRGVLP
jgi:hypothetical protein